MKVRIAGIAEALTITPDEVDGEVRWFTSNLCEGRLLDGRYFRCRVTPAEWLRFMMN